MSFLEGGGGGGAGFFFLLSFSKAVCIWLTREEMTVDNRLGSSCAFSLLCCSSSPVNQCVKASICNQHLLDLSSGTSPCKAIRDVIGGSTRCHLVLFVTLARWSHPDSRYHAEQLSDDTIINVKAKDSAGV